jgi:hypothetical protein
MRKKSHLVHAEYTDAAEIFENTKGSRLQSEIFFKPLFRDSATTGSQCLPAHESPARVAILRLTKLCCSIRLAREAENRFNLPIFHLLFLWRKKRKKTDTLPKSWASCCSALPSF